MESTAPHASPTQTWETSNIGLVRWLVPLLISLGLGWFVTERRGGHSDWLGALAIATLIAWPITGFVAAVQAVRFFFRCAGGWRKLLIAVFSLGVFLIEWAQFADLFHWGPD